MRRLLLLAGLAFATAATAASQTTSPAPLSATQSEQSAAKLLYGLLSDSRYSLKPLPKNSGALVFDAWLEALDPDRMYLSEADVRGFERLRAGMDTAVREGDFAAPFAIYDKYRARVDARLAKLRVQIATPQDFSVRESLEDGDGAWRNEAQLDERWRKVLKHDLLDLQIAGVDEKRARALVEKRYEASATHVREFRSPEVVELFLQAAAKVAEPGNDYFAPYGTLRDALDEAETARSSGAGVVLQHWGAYVTVTKVVVGGPADRSGLLHPGDRLVAIGEQGGEWQDVIGWATDEVVEKMRGETGSSLRLRFLDGNGATHEGSIVRERVSLYAQDSASSDAFREQGVLLATIRLPTFYSDFQAIRAGDPNARSASRDVKKILDAARAEGVQGIVLDLRGNGGGSLAEAVSVAALFLGKQPVVQIRENSGKTSIESGETEAAWTGHLAVVIDEDSAAASEIVAAALQDHRRAVVIGQRSAGRGSVQNIIDLDRIPAADGAPRFGKVKLTIAEMYRPSGESLAAGVRPFFELDKPLEERPARSPSPPLAAVPGLPEPQALPDAAANQASIQRLAGTSPWLAKWLASRAAMRQQQSAPAVSLNAGEARALQARRAPDIAAFWRSETRAAPLHFATSILAAKVLDAPKQ